MGRDWLIEFAVAVRGNVPHICELELKFVPIQIAVETGGSHEHYEYFRAYLSGGDRAAVQTRVAFLDKIGSADSVEIFVRDAMNGDDSVLAAVVSLLKLMPDELGLLDEALHEQLLRSTRHRQDQCCVPRPMPAARSRRR